MRPDGLVVPPHVAMQMTSMPLGQLEALLMQMKAKINFAKQPSAGIPAAQIEQMEQRVSYVESVLVSRKG